MLLPEVKEWSVDYDEDHQRSRLWIKTKAAYYQLKAPAPRYGPKYSRYAQLGSLTCSNVSSFHSSFRATASTNPC